MRTIKILHVDDSEGDIRLMQEAFREVKLSHTLATANNGYAALQYLDNIVRYKLYSSPDLILLDINMTLMNGLDLLEIIKNDVNIKHIPVIMFTTSSFEKDILVSYQKYANSFIIKPYNLDELTEVAKSIRDFWLKTASLP